MNYQLKTFTVRIGQREPKDCSHGWFTPKGRCVHCGTPRSELEPVAVGVARESDSEHENSMAVGVDAGVRVQ